MLKQLQDHDIGNFILRSLPPSTLMELLPHLSFVRLRRGQVLGHTDAHVDSVHFINSGLISLTRTMRDGRSAEVGVVGAEGVADLGAILGLEQVTLDMTVQIPGEAFRVSRNVLRDAICRSAPLRARLLRYAQWVIMQIAQTAACNRLHSLEQRCCRWLLVAHDSAGTENLVLTHEFLALILGVQRPSVSLTNGNLKRAGYIDYRAGHVAILDRAGLERASCECYETMRAQLGEFFDAEFYPAPTHKHLKYCAEPSAT